MRLKYPKEYRKVITSIRRKAKRKGVNLRFGIGKLVHAGDDDKDGSVGYFWMDTKPEMAIATDMPAAKWIQTLLHESCHLDQEFDRKVTKEKKDWWDKSCINYFEWMAGRKMMNVNQLEDAIRGTIDMEYDCELRTIAKIKKFNLTKEIDIQTYIKKTNTYLYGYPLVAQVKKWYNWVYNQESVYSKAPAELLKSIDGYFDPSEEFTNAFWSYISVLDAKEAA